MVEDESLERFFDHETEQENETQLLSRRQFLRGGMAGGAAGLVVAAGTGVAVWGIAFVGA